ncbi:MAG: 6-bladed beta-propeller [Acidobacteriota bacterium]|nr:6-bladed beta-propeller [Acidobacteriota bacterium]
MSRAACFILSFCMLALPATADFHKKAPVKVDPKKDGRYVFDISKLVWPNPPAMARIRYMNQLTGEKIDWDKFASLKKKHKQGWMDRIAGDKPLEQRKDLKIPYQLIRVYGMAYDSKGRLYAADQGVSAIFVFDLESGSVSLIRNRYEASFGMINGLAIDDDDRVFVSDTKLRHITVLNPDHKQVTSFGTDQLQSPAGLAIDTANRLLYVVDTQRDQVLVYSPDTFKLLRTIGTTGKRHTLSGPGQFSLPTNAAVDSEGNLYVTDTLNNRLEIFDASGEFVSEIGQPGDGPGFFARPKGIAIDPDGHIWVVDSVQQRVQVFDNTGRLLIYFGQPGGKPGQFNEAYGIAIDPKGRVAVSEQYIGRVQLFRYVNDAEAAALKAQKDAEEAKGTRPGSAPPSSGGGTKGSGDTGKNP